MSEYVLVLSIVQSVAAELEQCAGQLSHFSESAASVGERLSVNNLTAQAIRHNIAAIAGHLQEHSRNMSRMAETLGECAKRYELAETRICSGTVSGATIQWSRERIPSAGVTGSSTSGSGALGSSGSPILGSGAILGTRAAAVASSSAAGSVDSTTAASTAPGAAAAANPWRLQSDRNSFRASAHYGGWAAQNEFGAVSADLGSAEATGEWKLELDRAGGLPAPIVQASVGASVCALSASAQGSIGDDFLGASGQGRLALGSAEASGSVRASLRSEDGKLNPTLAASGSVEAVAAEASGELKGSLFGIGGSVKGSVNVGLGAHASAGFEDGVLSWDIGASVGVGASIGASLDVGGIADTVCSGAEAVYNYFNEWRRQSK